MVWVNLLPWRMAHLQRAWRIWRMLLFTLLLSVVAVAQSGYWQHLLNQQQAGLAVLWDAAVGDIAVLHGRTLGVQQQRDQLEQQWQQQQGQQQRMLSWHELASDLGTLIPEDVWLLSMKKTAQGVELRGMSDNIHHLHLLRQRLSEKTRLNPVTLGAIKRNSSGEMTFSMRAQLNERELPRE